jgi:hypothetical protein
MVSFCAEEPLQLESQPTAGEYIIGMQIQELLMAKSSRLVLGALHWSLIFTRYRHLGRYVDDLYP